MTPKSITDKHLAEEAARMIRYGQTAYGNAVADELIRRFGNG